MPDEVPTQPPPPPGPEHETTAKSTSTGLPSNVAAAIACIPLVGGIIFYYLEKQDSFVRFYAMQSIVLGGAWLLFYIAASIVGVIFKSIPVIAGVLEFFWGIVIAIVYIAFLVLWIITTVKAFTNVRWEIPYIGPIARKQMGET
jgi:Predicted membrane protein